MLEILRKKIQTLYQKIDNNISKQESIVNLRLNTLKDGMLSRDELIQDISDMQSYCNRIRNCLQELNGLLPDNLDIITSAKADMEIKYKDNMYFYYLKEALPHRKKVGNNKTTYDYDTNIFYSQYRNTILEYENENGFKPFNEKILIYILNKGPKNKGVRDADNLEIKPFIDAAVNKVLVTDDNMNNVAIHIDYCEDTTSSVMIVAGNETDVLRYICDSKHLS